MHSFKMYRWGVDDGFDAVVGANVRQYRQAAGLTQAAIGDALGLPQQTVPKIERGERPLRFAEAHHLAALFGIEVEALSAPSGAGVAAAVAATNEASRWLTTAALELGEQLGKLACAVHADESTEAADTLLKWDWAAEVDSAMLDAITSHHTTFGTTVKDALRWLVQHGPQDEDE
jgi:transcriptional regulator with XRE-family HTH domain